MAERQQRYTDFKDPFDLLTDLHSTRLRMIYQNEFARGDRSGIEMGTRAYPNSNVGRVNTPNYNLGAQAPSSMWQERQGSGRTLPPTVQMNYSRDYNDIVNEGTRDRIGSLLGPLSEIRTRYQSNISKTRRRQELKRIDSEQKQAKAAEEQDFQRRVDEAGPLFDRLNQLGKEEEETLGQIENTRLRLGVAEGLLERRQSQRRAEGKAVQERNKAGFLTASENIPSSAVTAMKKGAPYGTLEERDPEEVGKAMKYLFEDTPPTGQPGGTIPSMPVDLSKSTVQPGEVSPWPPVDKAKNTAALSMPSVPPLNTPGYPPVNRPLQGYETTVGMVHGTRGTVLRNIPVDYDYSVKEPPHLANRADNARKKERAKKTPPPPPGFNPSTAPTQPGSPPMHRRRPS